MSKWKEVWNRHQADGEIITTGSDREILIELKRAIGNDVVGDGISYEGLIKEYCELKENLSKVHPCSSVFEVGCGSGANLWLFQKDGVKVGGIDYSKSLIDNANAVLYSQEIVCNEAVFMTEEIKYDAVFAMRVFSYFENLEYAKIVLKKMCKKARYAVGLIDVHDKEKEDAFLEYRRLTIEDYDEKYDGLNKLFFERSFFYNIADELNMEIEFKKQQTDGYWNNDYGFNVYLYHKVIKK